MLFGGTLRCFFEVCPRVRKGYTWRWQAISNPCLVVPSLYKYKKAYVFRSPVTTFRFSWGSLGFSTVGSAFCFSSRGVKSFVIDSFDSIFRIFSKGLRTRHLSFQNYNTSFINFGLTSPRLILTLFGSVELTSNLVESECVITGLSSSTPEKASLNSKWSYIW